MVPKGDPGERGTEGYGALLGIERDQGGLGKAVARGTEGDKG